MHTEETGLFFRPMRDKGKAKGLLKKPIMYNGGAIKARGPISMSAPTDSVLKRHYEQMSQSGGGSASAAPSSSSSSQSGGGLFGWLKKLFCS